MVIDCVFFEVWTKLLNNIKTGFGLKSLNWPFYTKNYQELWLKKGDMEYKFPCGGRD
jgi:hypothetical protein